MAAEQESRSLFIPDGLAGERADSALARLLGLSRTQVAQILEGGAASQDGKELSKSTKLVAGAWLEVQWEQPRLEAEIVPEEFEELGIIFEDEHIVVVDKPVGVAVHPALSWHGPTVLGVLAARNITLATHGAAERQGVVQRLDVGTSGVMVVCKSNAAYDVLKRAFHDRQVQKIYHALVQGYPDPSSGTIDAAIARHPKSDWKFTVAQEGRHAVTHYRTLEAFRYGSLLEIELETGRTHQIRVHMSAQGHPCAGDPLYGSDPKLAAKLGLDRQWLHAVELSFEHPVTREQVSFRSEYPADLAEALRRIREL